MCSRSDQDKKKYAHDNGKRNGIDKKLTNDHDDDSQVMVIMLMISNGRDIVIS